jgi:hypothetical protein
VSVSRHYPLLLFPESQAGRFRSSAPASLFRIDVLWVSINHPRLLFPESLAYRNPLTLAAFCVQNLRGLSLYQISSLLSNECLASWIRSTIPVCFIFRIINVLFSIKGRCLLCRESLTYPIRSSSFLYGSPRYALWGSITYSRFSCPTSRFSFSQSNITLSFSGMSSVSFFINQRHLLFPESLACWSRSIVHDFALRNI